MEYNLVWFVNEMSTEKFPVLDEHSVKAMKNSLSPLEPHEQATRMFDRLLNWVDLDPIGLDEFVNILKMEPVRFKVILQNLDSGEYNLC
jgi:hypothetical protein